MVTKATEQPGCGDMVERVALATCDLAEDIGICPCMRIGGMNPSCIRRGENGIAAMRAMIDKALVPQPEPVNPGTAPNTESSPNAVPVAPGEAGRG